MHTTTKIIIVIVILILIWLVYNNCTSTHKHDNCHKRSRHPCKRCHDYEEYMYEKETDKSTETTMQTIKRHGRKALKMMTPFTRIKKNKTMPIITTTSKEEEEEVKIDSWLEPKEIKRERIALLIGINYVGDPGGELLTCYNDVCRMSRFLKETFNYQDRNIYLLTDVNVKNRQDATREHFLKTWGTILKKIKENHKKGIITEFIFHYSGHGGARETMKEDEKDHQQECMVFLDHVLWDADFRRLCLEPIPDSCRVLMIFDSCHSGTAANLPFVYNPLSGELDHESYLWPNTTHLMMISGCRDAQTSAAGMTSGDMSELTSALITFWSAGQCSKAPLTQTIKELRQYLLTRGQTQIPLLSFAHQMDIHVPLQK